MLDIADSAREWHVARVLVNLLVLLVASSAPVQAPECLRVRELTAEIGSDAVLDVRVDGAEALVELNQGTRLLGRRRIAFSPTRCATTASAIELLVRTWLNRPAVAVPPPLAVKPPVPSPATPSIPKSAAPPPRVLETKHDEPPRPVVPEPETVPVAPVTPPVLPAEPLPPKIEVPEPVAAPAPESIALESSLSARGQFRYDGVATFGGALALDLGLRRGFGGVVDGFLESPRTAAAGPGRVTAYIGGATLAARWALEAGPAQFIFGAGGRVEFIHAFTSNISQPASTTLVRPALVISAAVHFEITRRFFALVELGGVFRIRSESITVENVGEVLSISAFGGTGAVGLGWRF